MSGVQRSKRDRGRERMGLPAKQERDKRNVHPVPTAHTTGDPKYGWCDLCGLAVHNRGAHAEACSGARADAALRAVAADHPAVCQARRPRGFNAYTYCVLPFAHGGEHIYFADAESRRST